MKLLLFILTNVITYGNIVFPGVVIPDANVSHRTCVFYKARVAFKYPPKENREDNSIIDMLLKIDKIDFVYGSASERKLCSKTVTKEYVDNIYTYFVADKFLHTIEDFMETHTPGEQVLNFSYRLILNPDTTPKSQRESLLKTMDLAEDLSLNSSGRRHLSMARKLMVSNLTNEDYQQDALCILEVHANDFAEVSILKSNGYILTADSYNDIYMGGIDEIMHFKSVCHNAHPSDNNDNRDSEKYFFLLIKKDGNGYSISQYHKTDIRTYDFKGPWDIMQYKNIDW